MGALTWAGDQIVGMPPEYYDYYKHGRDRYIAEMDVVLGRVTDIVDDHILLFCLACGRNH